MVKSSLKLKKVNSEAQAMLTMKDKKKQAKLKTIKSKRKTEKLLEQQLSEKPKKIKKKSKGILGSLSALEESLKEIKYDDAKEVKSKLSKKEKTINRDTQRFEAVLQNRSFVANPLEAIRQHLQSQYN